MKLTTSFFVPLLAGTASAVSEASVYMFPRSANANAPALSPEQARLVFAQQMGISEYHSLGSPNEETLSYINEFGLSRDPSKQATRTLLIIVEGVSSQNQEPLLQAWAAAKPAFTISNPSSYKANEKLVEDLNFQAGASRGCQFQDAINPFTDKCWSSTAKALHVDLKKASIEQITHMEYKRLVAFASNGDMDAIIVLMPESSRNAKTPSAPYGSYEKASQVKISRRAESEEPLPYLSELNEKFSGDFLSQDVVAPNASIPLNTQRNVCFATLSSCISGSGNCTSHGSCQKKFASEDGSECYVCKCDSTLSNGTKYGGWACQKRDVSGPFWLILISSIVLMGLVGWGIGMLYSIGEEPLPGVISAGVSNTKSAR